VISSQAFTLVELLVVIGIITVITAGVIPGFNSYLDNQTLVQAQEAVKNDLRNVQNKALAGATYNGTTVPNYWGIKFAAGSNTYTILSTMATPNCDIPVVPGTASQKLPGTVTVATNACVLFKTSNGDLAVAGPLTVSVAFGTKNKSVQINGAGLIKAL
jgi:prepilin-type N-terminal cleavage/methylation domain-containing protein